MTPSDCPPPPVQKQTKTNEQQILIRLFRLCVYRTDLTYEKCEGRREPDGTHRKRALHVK